MNEHLRILRGAGAFQRVFSGRQRFISSTITFYFTTTSSSKPVCTVGFSVPSKHYRAVERNYLKRRMREAMRLNYGRINGMLEQSGSSMDLVLAVQNGIPCVRKMKLVDVAGDVESFCDYLVTRIKKQ